MKYTKLYDYDYLHAVYQTHYTWLMYCPTINLLSYYYDYCVPSYLYNWRNYFLFI